MNKEALNPLRWKRPFLFSLLIALIAIWFLFIDTHSLFTRFQLEQRKKDLIERTREYEERTAELEQEIKDLESNPDLLEKIAREEYGMRKPDETVYKIKENP